MLSVGVTLALLGNVTFADLPLFDDLSYAPPLAGIQGVGAFLVHEHYGHRLLLPKMLDLGALWLSGNRFWSVRVLNIALVLSSAAVWLAALREARVVRTRTRLLVVLLLVQPGVAGSLVHGFDLQFILHSTFCALVIFAALRGRRSPALKWIALSWIALSGLGLSGANGAIAAVPIAVGVALVQLDAARNTWLRISVVLLAVGTGVLSGGLIAWTAEGPGHPALFERLGTALQFLAMFLGPPAREAWPVSGAAALLVMAAGGRALVRLVPGEQRDTGILLGAAWCSTVLVALAVGYARTGWGGDPKAGLMGRYACIAVVGIITSLAMMELSVPAATAATPRPTAIWIVQTLLTVGVLAAAVADTPSMLNTWLSPRIGRFRRDIASGVPPGDLAVIHADLFPTPDVAGGLFALCSGGLGPYRDLARSRRRCEGSKRNEPRTELVETSFSVLAQFEPACNGQSERFGNRCAFAAHAFCAAHGFSSGFGPVENRDDRATVTCTRDAVVRDGPACPKGPTLDCVQAVSRECKTAGMASGYAVSLPATPAQPARVLSICLPHADTKRLSFSELSRNHAKCRSQDDLAGPNCAAAIHRRCSGEAAISGFGLPAAQQSEVDVVCLAR
jgi:hypothetical protein